MSEPKRESGDWGSLARVLSYARPQWVPLAVSVAVLGLGSLCGVLSARSIGLLIERGLLRRDATAAYRLGAAVLALELGAVIAAYWGRRLMAFATNSALLLIRERLFAHLNRLPMRYFDREPLGRTVTRMTYDVEGLEDFFGGTLARLLNALLTLALVLAGMLATDWRLGGLVVVSMIPAVFATWLFRGPLRHWNREFAQRNSAINARLSEFLNGIPVIRGFGAEDWSRRSFDATVDSHLEAAIRINVLNSWSRPVVLILCALPLVMLLWFGGHRVQAGTLGLGLFVSFIRYTERFSRPISAIAQEINTIQAAFTSAERVSRFLEHPPEAVELGADGTLRPPTLNGAVEFRDVTMAYEAGRPVLRALSARVRPGEKIGLAGRTGSGKSTTAALLSRLYEFQSGEVLIDGVSIREYAREDLRRHIGFVSQDVTIFRGSLFENLAFGAGVSPESVLAAARRTGFDRVLNRRGLSLDSALLDQGANLSAGEKQLIALTRVLVRDPSLLILDEATSNIDASLEQLVQQAVLSVMKGRTCFMIAHRLATLEACNRILVFRGGRIVEQGSHAELLRAGGYYAELLRESEATVAL